MILMTVDENVTIPTDLKSQIRTEIFKDLNITWNAGPDFRLNPVLATNSSPQKNFYFSS